MKLVKLFIIIFVATSCMSTLSFAKTYYLVKNNNKKVNIEKLLPSYLAENPVPYGIYIPNAWGGKYKKFNEKFGKKYGKKVLGGYEYTSSAILAIIYKGKEVVDSKGQKVEFLPKTIRKQLMYAVASPSKVNDILFNVITNYIVNDYGGGVFDNNYSSGNTQ